jgi:hypothetical protein
MRTDKLRSMGVGATLTYLGIAVFFGFTNAPTTTAAIFIVCVSAVLAWLYFAGIKHAARSRMSIIVICAVGFSLIGAMTPAFDSTDVFFYMATGWGQAHYHMNPYSTSLRETTGAAGDPMIYNQWMARSRNAWLDLPLAYGFLFAIIERGIAWLGMGNFWATLGLFKLLNLGMHAGTAILLWKACRFFPGVDPKTVVYLYSWNPLVILEYLANGHNDILVAFLITVAAYAVLRGYSVWTIPALVLAGLIKYVPVVLVPFAFVFLVREKSWGAAIRSSCLAVLVAVPLALPYVGDLSSFKYKLILQQLSESTASFHAFLFYCYRALSQVGPAIFISLQTFSNAVQLAMWAFFAAFLLREFHAACTEKTPSGLTLIERWTSVLFMLIFFVSSKFWAWYIGMLLPLALLMRPESILRNAVIVLSGSHLLSFTSLRRKAIGYFLAATATPFIYAWIHPWKPKFSNAAPEKFAPKQQA